jgi:hypothetical protein
MGEHLAQQLNQWSLWAHPHPDKCPCGGSGWLLSDYDTWHECGLHRHGAPHPEDEDAEHNPERMLRVYRDAYRTFMRRSGVAPKDFRRYCVAHLRREPSSPKEWVDAAEAVFLNHTASYF